MNADEYGRSQQINFSRQEKKKNREMPGCNIGPEHCDCC